jgi:hypothetical protein
MGRKRAKPAEQVRLPHRRRPGVTAAQLGTSAVDRRQIRRLGSDRENSLGAWLRASFALLRASFEDVFRDERSSDRTDARTDSNADRAAGNADAAAEDRKPGDAIARVAGASGRQRDEQHEYPPDTHFRASQLDADHTMIDRTFGSSTM